MSGRRYPDTPAGPFPSPPETFEDSEGRSIDVHGHGSGPVDEECDALYEMYASFDPSDRAQGLPPSRESSLRDWLERLLSGPAVNVIAWHEVRAAGHATLVPDDEGAYELAIFVHQEYQHAGIGSRLLRCLLGEGSDRGIERVWLTVERWNSVAISLYRDVGFETTSSESFEIEMGLRLPDTTGSD